MSNEFNPGQVFGEWTVLEPASKPYYTKCKCSCGKVKDVSNSALRRGKTQSCGHRSAEINKKRGYEISDKIIGKTFGRLTVVKRANESGKSRYLCQCTCGKSIVVYPNQLHSGKTKSCGCLKREKSKRNMAKIQQKGVEVIEPNFVEGTYLLGLQQKVSRNSKTGVKGVSEMNNGKFRAYINIKKKQIHLGMFDTLEEATETRLNAEEKYYKPILEKYTKKEG